MSLINIVMLVAILAGGLIFSISMTNVTSRQLKQRMAAEDELIAQSRQVKADIESSTKKGDDHGG